VWTVTGVATVLFAVGVALGAGSGEDVYLLPIGVPFLAVGGLLATHHSRNPIGWMFLAFGLVSAVRCLIGAYAERAIKVDPSLPGGDWAATIAAHIWHPAFGLLVFSFLLFPNGRMLSPRWRWVGRAAIVTYVGLLLSGPFDTDFLRDEFLTAHPVVHGTVADVGSIVFGLLLFVNLGLLLAAGVSLVLRLRHSRGEEREQVKWFVYTVAFVMFSFPVSVLVAGSGSIGVFTFPLIPIAAGVAIFKYRLYAIDVVINRTLVYGSLTAALAATYLGSVLLLQLLLGDLTKSSGLAVAASTLAVAALFRPARARIQAAVDRRFYRRKYDAARTLEGFSSRLREQVDLDALGHELRAVVSDTMQPAHVSLWLRKP
jgi:hypothetical protein